jgi:phage-related protein
MENVKEIRWAGSAYDDLLAFPDDARRTAGFQLTKVGTGRSGTGRLASIRSSRRGYTGNPHPGEQWHLPSDVYRQFEEAIYVLHCFQKKTQATSKHDKDIAQARYRAVISMRREGK